MTLRPKVRMTLVAATGLLGLMAWAGVALASHPHPANNGALRQQTTSVPAFEQCGGSGGQSPDRQHGPPLSFPSCSTQSPADLTSNHLTVGPAAAANTVIQVICTNGAAPPCPAGAPDQEDVRITSSGKDIRCQRTTVSAAAKCGPTNTSGGTDYTGTVTGQSLIRVTDHFNRVPPTGAITQSATMTEIPFSVGGRCTSTPANIGSNCNVTTSADAVVPGSGGAVKERKQSLVEIKQIQIVDGGPDGQNQQNPLNPGHCPPSCIAGSDDTIFAVEGIQIP